MWTDLSMKDKSDLMSLFLKQGISSLSDMRRIYDGEQDTPANDTTKVENINRYNNPTLLKYAGTNVEPIIRDYMYFAETPQKAAKFLADRNITENRDVVDYFNSYVNSDGYKRIQQNQSNWWRQRHPYRKYTDLGLHKEGAKELRNTVNKVDKTKAIRAFNLDTYSNLSFFVPNSGNAYIGNIPTTSRYPNVTYSFEPTYVTGHEVAHRYNGNLETLMGAQREALQYKINTKITGDKDVDEHHDNYLDEIHSDVWGLKYLLFKEGIYDSRSNKDITIEEIKKLREKYPNLRPLMQSTDEELVWRLNHIASLDKKINTENLAAFGGRIYNGKQDIDKFNFKRVSTIEDRPKDPEPYIDKNWTKEYKDLPLEYKKAINELFSKMNFKTNDYESLYNSHKYWNIINAYYKGTPSERLRDNDSPTKDKSEYYENHMNSSIYNREGYVSPNMKYAIPYDESKEIVIPTIGRVPTNALDSIAKYSYQAEIPLYEGLGLSGQETNFGAIPLYNMQSIPKGASQEERDNIKFNNRALGNASYFRNYGYIPAEYMVRDFRYNLEGHAIDRDVPPLLHAFQYYKQGKYNPGDLNHTNDVRERGEFIINTKPIQEWIQSSPYAQKALQIK